LTDEEKRGKIIEIINREEGIAMAVETLGTFTQSELEYIRESSLIKGQLDYQADMAEARAEARLEGRAEGLNEGRMEGRAEGRADGRAEGRADEKLEIARKMKAAGRPLSEIAEFTGLATETIINTDR
jgi:predicted transposase YdaD